MRKRSAVIIASLAMMSLTSIGFSSWSVFIDRQNASANIKEVTPVAYIGSTYYTSIEKAVSVANASDSSSNKINIYVIPGTNPTIKSSLTIDQYVTLNLPYEGENVFDVNKEDGEEKDTTVSALDNPSIYRKNIVSVAKNCKITNNGTINIGGIVGSAGGAFSPAGQTCSYYSELYLFGMNDSSVYQIENYGTIKNKGSITSPSSSILGIHNNKGANLLTNFVMGENYGGSALLMLRKNQGGTFTTSPFKRIYMPNITSTVRIEHSSTVTGLAGMQGNGLFNATEVALFGTSSSYMFQSYSGSYLIASSSKKEVNGLSYKADVLDLDFYGSFAMNSMSLKVEAADLINVTISTTDCHFPLSYMNDITFNSTSGSDNSVKFNQKMKILPGGRLTIGEGVDFTAGSLVNYSSWSDSMVMNGSKWSLVYPSGLDAGYFEVNGSATISEYGGYIYNNVDNATLSMESNSVTVKEVTTGTFDTGASALNPFNKGDFTYQDMSFTASGLSSDGGTKTLKGGDYTSKDGVWNMNQMTIQFVSSSSSSYWAFGTRYRMPQYTIYVADDSSGSNETAVKTISSDNSYSSSNRSDYAYTVDPDKYIKVTDDKGKCDSIKNGSEEIEFNKWYLASTLSTITVNRSKE